MRKLMNYCRLLAIQQCVAFLAECCRIFIGILQKFCHSWKIHHVTVAPHLRCIFIQRPSWVTVFLPISLVLRLTCKILVFSYPFCSYVDSMSVVQKQVSLLWSFKMVNMLFEPLTSHYKTRQSEEELAQAKQEKSTSKSLNTRSYLHGTCISVTKLGISCFFKCCRFHQESVRQIIQVVR